MGKYAGSSPEPPDPNLLTPEATVDLLEQVKHGDDAALDKLLERCIPPLRRWARGRLPQSARGMQDTADLVQDAVFSAMRRLEAFEARHQGALQA
jgi:DNA-directed RNA polymerase specialized sigma24 family protein